jgi:penicillin-binding protein-related factor A (putative recombinase)
MTNPGKEFEKDYKNSIPPEIWEYRLRDGTANWRDGDQSNTRFQQTNICNFILFWDGTLALQELKSHKGKSLPHKEFMNSKGDIKHLRELEDAAEHTGIYAGVLINMREVSETWYLPVDKVLHHIYFSGVKSIPLAYMRDHGYLVRAEKKRTRWRYDIKDLMKHLKYD